MRMFRQRFSRLKNIALRFSKFSAVGFAGYAVDNGMYFLLSTWWTDTALRTWVIPLISYEIAMFNNYLLSYYWVWRDRNHKGKFITRLLIYNAATAIPFLVRMAAYVQLFRVFQLQGIVSNMIAVLIGVLFNFFVCEKLIFRRKPETYADRKAKTSSEG
jgi:putative flippase GtrA